MRVDDMPAVELTIADMQHMCGVLFDIAQRHTPQTAFSDVNELVQLSQALKAAGIESRPAVKLKANLDDYSPSVTKQSAEYRLLKARYSACLSTIADLAGKRPKKNKSAFHAGVHEGLRRAAKVAIMFLDDIAANKPLLPNKLKRKTSDFVR